MGCGCGKGGVKYQYVYTSTSGDKQTFQTELEAKARVIRSGGSYEAVPK